MSMNIMISCDPTHLCQSGALHVFDSLQIAGQLLCRLRSDGFLFVLGKLLNSRRIISQINLCPHQQERGLWTVVGDLRYPLKNQTIFPPINVGNLQGQTECGHLIYFCHFCAEFCGKKKQIIIIIR